jgi:hypothetical protein
MPDGGGVGIRRRETLRDDVLPYAAMAGEQAADGAWFFITAQSPIRAGGTHRDVLVTR